MTLKTASQWRSAIAWALSFCLALGLGVYAYHHRAQLLAAAVGVWGAFATWVTGRGRSWLASRDGLGDAAAEGAMRKAQRFCLDLARRIGGGAMPLILRGRPVKPGAPSKPEEKIKMSWLSKILGLDNTPILKDINAVGKVLISTVESTVPGATGIINAAEALGGGPITVGSVTNVLATVEAPVFAAFESGLISWMSSTLNISAEEADDVLNGIATKAGITTTVVTQTTLGTPPAPSAPAPAPKVNAFAPSIASFEPPAGGTGTIVTLTGSGFTGASEVTVNGVQATNVAVITDATITFEVPAGSTPGPIVVTTPNGQASSAEAYGA